MTRKLLPILMLLFLSANLFSQSFNSIWTTSNTSTGSSAANEITIPINPAYTYNYSVDWGDGTSDANETTSITHTYAAPGTYTIMISGTFPAIYFNNSGDRNKIIEILDWGTIQWQTMEDAFHGCENVNFDAIGAPNLSQVTSLRNMFKKATAFNGIMNGWNVSTITDISGLFYEAGNFDRPLDTWDTSAITDMSYTFYRASRFKEPLDNWNTAAVTTMEYLFSEAGSFNQNINNWNVSNVTNMIGTFRYAGSFNQPLNNWVVDNVTDMSQMLSGTAFNHPIANWNVSNVTNMSRMFYQAQFNQPIEAWDVSNVTDMSYMLARMPNFNRPVNGWNVSAVTNMEGLFDGWPSSNTPFNQPLNGWDVSNVTNMSYMFRYTRDFNQPLNNWVVDNVTDMEYMFERARVFNQDISGWNVDNVTNMNSMFQNADVFNQNISGWNVGNVTDMGFMFYGALVFDQPLNGWSVDQVTTMRGMFGLNPVFNQPLDSWNTSTVTNMNGMFYNASAFNQNLAAWDISNISDMGNMLSNSGLSQENYDNALIGWETQTVQSNVNLGATNLNYCDGLNARQNLIDNSGWNITGDIVNCSFVLCTNLISPIDGDTNVPASANLTWAQTPNATGYYVTVRIIRGGVESIPFNDHDVPGGNTVGLDLENLAGDDLLEPGDEVFVTIVPYNSSNERATGCAEESFTVVPSWVNSPDAFKLTYDTSIVDTDTTPANQLKIEANTGYPGYLVYDYSIDWGDDQFDNHVTGDITHTYLAPGVYTVSIIGNFPAPFHDYSGTDNIKLISIDQWGTQEWQSMERAFYYCENMEYNATDIPDLSNVTLMNSMYAGCNLFNGNIDSWDVSNVTEMASLFIGARSFNQPLNNWNVGNVTTMRAMFLAANVFDQPLNNWNTGSVINMSRMFEQADVFNQNINNWNVSNVVDMSAMFERAQAYNQPLNNWDVSNVTNMNKMFDGFVFDMVFDQPLDNWDVDNVTDMSYMFRRNVDFNRPLNVWNTSNVTNMAGMFQDTDNFDQPLDSWNVSSVTNMRSMFSGAEVFDQDINSWNVTNVTTTNSMFSFAEAFNQPLSSWDVNSVVDMSSMFRGAQAFNQPLNSWDVSAVANMSSMFESALLFNQPLNSWNVSSVTLMNSMFEEASVFNGVISNWNVASVTNMEAMFKDAIAFDQDIQNWDTGEALTMQEMFKGASVFNQVIDSWDTSFVNTMESMFEDATTFNQPLDSWNTASVTTMEKMFKGASAFNQDINAWNVRGADTMEEMFEGATAFNQSVNNWRVSGVTNMDEMFQNASAFNQPLDQWDLGSVSMRSAFQNASALNQYLGDWDISSVSNMTDMLDNTALTRENYDNTLIAWSEQTPISGITLGAEGLPYCDALEERQSMIDTYGWTFSLDVQDCPLPECTQLASPLDGATDVPVNTNINWEPALYARGYFLTVGTTPGGSDIVNNETINDETFYEFAADFNTGDEVYVTLIPFNDEGDAVGPCTEERFTISSDPATIPDCTNLTEPLNNATEVVVTTDLSWNPISNADGYRLTVGTSLTGNDILDDEDVGNITEYDFATDLPEDTDIFVTITPYNDQGHATLCTVEEFHTELIPVAPSCTNLIAPGPINGATDIPIDTNLSWDAVTEATGYLVIVGTTSNGIEVVNNVDVGNMTSYDIPDDLQESRLYYVTIIPYNDVGDAMNCTEESFRTGDSTSPPSCTLLSTPSNGATAVAIDTDLSWNGSGTADGYRITVGTTSGGTDIFSGDVGNMTIHDFATDLPESTTIYVNITAYNVNGDATGCTEESFTTDGPPSCTTLVSPANLETNVAIDVPSITWNASANADSYDVIISASGSTANNGTFEVTSGTTYSFPNVFELGDVVTVTIIPSNAFGDATGCTSESFTIVPPPVPACTSLSSATIDVGLRPTIEWNASAGADGYKLTVIASSSTANNLTELDIPSGTTYTFTDDFEQGETVAATIVPYNSQGNATCSAENLSIKAVPSCNSLIIPGDGAVDVAVDTGISWTIVSDATGYRLSIVASSSTANNVTDVLVTSGNTYDFPNDFEQGETVTVTLVPYNEVGDAISCADESFTIKPVPSCTNLTLPNSGAVDVPVETDLTWNAVSDADGYRVTVNASVSTGNNQTFDITGTTIDLPNDFEQGETVEVTIIPYNEIGDAIGCNTASFTVESVPTCTALLAPSNEAEVADVSEIFWVAIADADGYRLTINAANSTANNVTDLVVTGTTYVFPNNFDEGEVVNVTIIPFNAVGDAVGCTTERFTIRPIPPCTQLVDSLNGATDVSVITDISWNMSPDADGYRISVGTSPNGTDIVNDEDVASLTSYTFAEDLPSESLIYVAIIPYNTSGDAVGCASNSFETEIVLPECTVLNSPFNEEIDVSLDSGISWTEVEKTDGYRISIGTNPGGSDIVDNLDLGMATSYNHSSEFPFDTEIFVSIVPYNSAGDATQCEQQSFTTLVPEDNTKYGFSPDGDGINEYWHIENIEYYPENVVIIYNRWGDAVFRIENYDNASEVFRGDANLKTKMGAGRLPSGTYFFEIQIEGETILKKTKGYVVIKR